MKRTFSSFVKAIHACSRIAAVISILSCSYAVAQEVQLLASLPGNEEGQFGFNLPANAESGSFSHPRAGVIVGYFGDLYGVSEGGSFRFPGGVFKYDTNTSTLSPIHRCYGDFDGIFPQQELTRALNGRLYGTFFRSGADAFSIGGDYFYFFPGEKLSYQHLQTPIRPAGPAFPSSPFVSSDSYGFVMGLSSAGGENDQGTIYRILTVNNSLEVVHSFNGEDGSSPRGPLVKAGDDYWYGVTEAGGLYNAGVLFRINEIGEFEVVSHLTENNGLFLYHYYDGQFYGVERGDQSSNEGALISLSKTGEKKILHTFTGGEGSNPQNLTLAKDGRWYGVAANGGSFNKGTLFSYSLTDGVSAHHSFEGDEGENPLGRLAEGDSNTLFGTAFKGGELGYGTLFKVSYPAPQRLKVTGFALYDAETDEVIPGYENIQGRVVFPLSSLPAKALGVKALISNPATGSVMFRLWENKVLRIDNSAPFSLFGDNDGNFFAWRPNRGSYVIEAVPFERERGAGKVGLSAKLTLVFTQ